MNRRLSAFLSACLPVVLFSVMAGVAMAQGFGQSVNAGGGINGAGGGRGGSTFGGSSGAFGGATGGNNGLSAEMADFTFSENAGTFVGGANANTQGNFVGSGPIQGTQAAGQLGNRAGQFGGGAAGQFGNRGNAQGGQFGGNQGRGGGGNSVTPLIRTRLSVAFDYSSLQPTNVGDSLSNQFGKLVQMTTDPVLGSRLSQTFKDSQIEVTVVNREAVLTGLVRSVRDSELAGQIVKLEPGVDRVTNQLAVVPPQ